MLKMYFVPCFCWRFKYFYLLLPNNLNIFDCFINFNYYEEVIYGAGLGWRFSDWHGSGRGS